MKIFPAEVLLFAAYTAANVTSLLLIKAWLPVVKSNWSEGITLGYPALFVATGASLYVVSFLVWMIILARHNLTLAYPITIGLTLVFSSIFAVLLLNEQLPPNKIAGICLIFIGIVLVVRA